MERFRNRQKGGFTLVELALVLVIIGLLITGVLKGEALIQNAKVKNVVNQKDSVTAAFYTYYDRYNYYPGDCNVANIPVQGHTDPGNLNGQIDANLERSVLFQDLVLAQIINGGYTGAAGNYPTNAFGGQMYIQYLGVPPGSAVALNANCIIMTAIPADVAQQIDSKYDDGVYNTGTIRSDTVYTNTAIKTMYWRM
ncbi:MAG TPA: prepilin-type N-terminal cleavage/methylation domain-containing protein [Desulfomonilia bacterium]|nr:prepilin-type N-terminal cleavage/methylation domain-containing protein [Desulfomonilia bacterium]